MPVFSEGGQEPAFRELAARATQASQHLKISTTYTALLIALLVTYFKKRLGLRT